MTYLIIPQLVENVVGFVSNIENYFEIATKAIKEMIAKTLSNYNINV